VREKRARIEGVPCGVKNNLGSGGNRRGCDVKMFHSVAEKWEKGGIGKKTEEKMRRGKKTRKCRT